MDTTIQPLKTPEEVIDWIATKYVFNEDVYPTMKLLLEEHQQEAFVAKHCLLHIFKSFVDLLCIDQNTISWSISSTSKERLHVALAKAAVNLIALAHQVRLPASVLMHVSDFVREKRSISTQGSTLLLDFTETLGRIAAFYEKIDHEGASANHIDREVADALGYVLLIQEKFIGQSQEDFFRFIPTVMKSK